MNIILSLQLNYFFTSAIHNDTQKLAEIVIIILQCRADLLEKIQIGIRYIDS